MIISSISWGIAKFGAWITVTSEVRLLWWTCFDQTFRMCDKWFYLGAFSITQILNPSNEAGATQEMRNLLRLVGDRDFTKLSSGHMVVWLYVNLQHWETLNAWQAVKIGTMWGYTLIRYTVVCYWSVNLIFALSWTLTIDKKHSSLCTQSHILETQALTKSDRKGVISVAQTSQLRSNHFFYGVNVLAMVSVCSSNT